MNRKCGHISSPLDRPTRMMAPNPHVVYTSLGGTLTTPRPEFDYNIIGLVGTLPLLEKRIDISQDKIWHDKIFVSSFPHKTSLKHNPCLSVNAEHRITLYQPSRASYNIISAKSSDSQFTQKAIHSST